MDQKKEKEATSFQVTDRRFWVEDESAIEDAAVPEEKYPTFVEQLKARTEAAEQKLKERIEQLERENQAFRERLNSQIEQRVARQKADLVESFLDILDNLERALSVEHQGDSVEVLREGVQLNLDLFLNKLKAAGVTTIENLRQPFDPNEAEAIGVVSVDDPELDSLVVEVLQKGYRMGEAVIRPAMVNVGRYAGK